MELFEAFKALEALNEDTFSVSDDGIAKLDEFQSNDEITDEIDVIDPEAETEEDLEDSYVGKVILDCCVCHSKIYKAKEEVELNDDETLANVGEDCPFCYTSDGFKIIGEVTDFAKDTEEDKEEKVEDSENDNKEEIVEESLNEAVATLDRPMSELQGTLGQVMTAHKDELASVFDRQSAIDFLTGIEPEVKNKNYLASIKAKVAMLPDRKVTQFLYNIILKGDGMSAKLEDVKEDLLVRGEDGKLTTTSQDGRWGNSKEWNYNNEELEEAQSNSKDYVNKFIADFNLSKDKIRVKKGPYETTSSYIEPGYYGIYIQEQDAPTPKELDAAKEKYHIGHHEVVTTKWSGGRGAEWKVLVTIKGSEKLKESVNNVNVETDEDIINVVTDDNGKVTVTTEPKTTENTMDDAEVIAPVSDETKLEIEQGIVDDVVEPELDEFDEESFNELGESYLKEVYENVDSFKVKSVSESANGLVVEGIIKFDSGALKATKFLFEAAEGTKENTFKFSGENSQLTESKNAFSLCGKIEDRKFISESMDYHYRTTDAKVRGSVKRG